MKTWITILWTLLPIVGAALWFGPGAELRDRADAAAWIEKGQSAYAEERWEDAVLAFTEAHDLLPEDATTERARVRLDEAEARIQAGEMVEGQEILAAVLDELETSGADAELATSVRHALATSSYHAGWLMRLEGATPEEWLPETERARQHFRLLAESHDGEAQGAFAKNLEATIRLEQMDLSDLQALPLPKDCSCNCNNLSQRKRHQQKSRSRPKEPKDARDEVKKEQGAGLSKREGSGS